MVGCLLYRIQIWQQGRDRKNEKVEEKAPAQEKFSLAAAFPDTPNIVVLGLTALFAVLMCFRRKVLIVDDLLNFQFSNAGQKKSVRRSLDLLKQLPVTHHPIVLLSSNEGICQLFSDKNETTFAQKAFPQIQLDELVDVLELVNVRIPLDSLKAVEKTYGAMTHHFYSIRWWGIVLNSEMVETVVKDERRFPRSVLRHICLQLDLECQEIARSYALSYSAEVGVAAALKGYFTDAEVQLVVKTYGARGPRRCVLTVALLITGREARTRGELAAAEEERDDAADKQRKFPSDDTHKKRFEAAEQKVSDLSNYLCKLEAEVNDKSAEEDVLEYEFAMQVRKLLFPVPNIEAFENDVRCDREMDRVKRHLS
jgi:hypothetical protein